MRIFEEGLQVGRYPFSIMAKLEKPCLSAPASFFSMFLLSVTRNMRIEIEATAARFSHPTILNQSMNESGMTSHSHWLRSGVPPDFSGHKAAIPMPKIS